MALQISAFKGIRYDRWKGEKKLFDPTWLLVDDKISNICQEFSKCDESQRNSLRNLISDDINNTLVTYSLRMSIFAMRQSNL
ncbi:MAG TPA: hypothetical protein DCX53_11015, partial [Anaerolineae bacterium]|nr:hypothetical protein [Anaerolineae bacterium]